MSSRKTLTLLNNIAVTGDGPVVTWPGGIGTYQITGTFGGTTATLLASITNGTTENAYTSIGTNSVLTANGICNFELPPCKIKVNLTGGTPSAMYAFAVPRSTTD